MDQKTFGASIAGLMYDLSKSDKRSSQLLPEGWKTEDPLLQLADRFSVGLATTPATIPAPPHTQLSSIFCLIELTEKEQILKAPEELYLPLKKLQTQAGDFPFPAVKNAASDVLPLTNALIDSLHELASQRYQDPEILIEKFLSLLQQYGWCLPSPSHPDLQAISLYDHSRITAALSACLAPFPDDQIQRWHSGQDLDKQVCSLMGGDISGIQNFIYTITSKGSASALRGRSLYLQFLTDAVARFVLQRLQLPMTNLVFAGGGHFFILVRKGDESKIKQVQLEVSKILLAAHGGDLYLALAAVPLEVNALSGEALSKRWSLLSENLRESKLRKFSELEGDLHASVFAPRRDQGNQEKECKVCGREDKNTSSSTQKCPQCSDFEKLGKDLRRARFLGVTRVKEQPLDDDNPPGEVAEILAAFGVRFTLFDTVEEIQKEVAHSSTIYYALDDDGLGTQTNSGNVFGRKFLVNVTPLIDNLDELEELLEANIEDLPDEEEVRGGAVKPFSALEHHSGPNFKRLGILRMDVDNMGRIISEGLGKHANLARLASLSFLVNLYFEGITAELARAYNREGLRQKYDHVYSVYSGGDDLFFVGSWDVMPRLALDIRNHLQEFVAKHPAIHLSGGIALVDGKYPLYQSAEDGSEALESSKGQVGKNSLTFLGQSVPWEKFAEVMEIEQELARLVSQRQLPRDLLQRLMGFQLQFEEKRKEARARGEEMNRSGQEQLLWGSWNWKSAYYLKRMKLKPDDTDASKFVKELAAKLEQEKFGDIEWIGFAARWADLETRGG